MYCLLIWSKALPSTALSLTFAQASVSYCLLLPAIAMVMAGNSWQWLETFVMGSLVGLL